MRSFKALTTMLVLGVLAASSAFAQAPEKDRLYSIQATSDFASKYIWRGQMLNEEPVLQFGADATVKAGPGQLALAWWGNMDLTDANGRTSKNTFTEYDWKVGYGMLFKQPIPVSLEMGLVYYYFPRASTDNETAEMYAKAEAVFMDPEDFPLSLSAVLAMYYDTDEAEGWYMNAAVKGDFKVIGKWDGSFLVGIGAATNNYNQYYFGESQNSLNDLRLEAALGAPIDNNIRLKIGAGYSALIDNDLKRAVERGTASTASTRPDGFWFSVGLHATF